MDVSSQPTLTCREKGTFSKSDFTSRFPDLGTFRVRRYPWRPSYKLLFSPIFSQNHDLESSSLSARGIAAPEAGLGHNIDLGIGFKLLALS
jgi:hypothetical protein